MAIIWCSFLRYEAWRTKICCHFGPLIPHWTTWKIKILKIKIKKTPKQTNKKNHVEISSFYTSVWKIIIICYTVPEIWHVGNVISIFHLGYFFCPFTALQIFLKLKKKKHMEISSFNISVPKTIITWYMVPEIWCTNNGQMHRQKEWHIEVGTPPKNNWKDCRS